MPAFTVPIHEFNPNHEPAGSARGGQFARKKSWHLTADPHFTPDPAHKPSRNRIRLADFYTADPAGLFVTDDPEYWKNAHGYEQPYVAEVEGVVTNPPGAVMVHGKEEFMQGDMKTVRVLTLDEYARETYGEPGWVEEYFAPTRMFGQARKKFPNYVGRSVAEMTPVEIRDWERKFKKYARRSDGPRARAARAEREG